MDIPRNARQALDDFWNLIQQTKPHETTVRLAPDAWTLAEIVGHLVDSASNNHQRFVRLTFGDLPDFPPYTPEPWVEAQNYATADWQTLTPLWRTYNSLLLHVVESLPESALANAWITPDGPLTLKFLATDYYDHLRLHITHYQTRLTEIREAN